MNKPRLFSLSYEGTSRTQGMSVCFFGMPKNGSGIFPGKDSSKSWPE